MDHGSCCNCDCKSFSSQIESAIINSIGEPAELQHDTAKTREAHGKDTARTRHALPLSTCCIAVQNAQHGRIEQEHGTTMPKARLTTAGRDGNNTTCQAQLKFLKRAA